MDMILPVAVGVLTLIATLSGIYLAHHLQAKRSEKQERRRLYMQLMGLRAALYQHAGLHGDATINSRYNAALARGFADQPRNTYYDQRRQFWEDKTIEATRALVESHMRLMETIGGIHMHFDRTDKLDSLTHRLFHIEFLTIEPVENVGADHMKALRVQWKSELNSYLTKGITQPVDALALYLRDQLADD